MIGRAIKPARSGFLLFMINLLIAKKIKTATSPLKIGEMNQEITI
jgi:hypothetical protein